MQLWNLEVCHLVAPKKKLPSFLQVILVFYFPILRIIKIQHMKSFFFCVNVFGDLWGEIIRTNKTRDDQNLIVPLCGASPTWQTQSLVWSSCWILPRDLLAEWILELWASNCKQFHFIQHGSSTPKPSWCEQADNRILCLSLARSLFLLPPPPNSKDITKKCIK